MEAEKKNKSSGVHTSFILFFIHFIGIAPFDCDQTSTKGEGLASTMGLSREPVKVLFWLGCVEQQSNTPARSTRNFGRKAQIPSCPTLLHNNSHQPLRAACVACHLWLSAMTSRCSRSMKYPVIPIKVMSSMLVEFVDIVGRIFSFFHSFFSQLTGAAIPCVITVSETRLPI